MGGVYTYVIYAADGRFHGSGSVEELQFTDPNVIPNGHQQPHHLEQTSDMDNGAATSGQISIANHVPVKIKEDRLNTSEFYCYMYVEHSR